MGEFAVSYPHPVVGHGDDAAGAFECEPPAVDFHVGKCTLVFPRMTVGNAVVAELLRQGAAAYLLRIECGATMLRETRIFDRQDSARVELRADLLLGRVDVFTFVVATNAMEMYRPSGLSADYGDATFFIEAGDVLALGPEFIFSAEKEFDPLKGEIPSIMRVKGGDFEGPFRVNFDTSLIEVQLGKTDWERYLKLKQTGSEVLHSALVLPVLTQAICEISSDLEKESANEARSDLVWYKRLTMMLQMRGWDASASAVEWAQSLLDNPFQRTADAVLRLHEKGDDL